MLRIASPGAKFAKLAVAMPTSCRDAVAGLSRFATLAVAKATCPEQVGFPGLMLAARFVMLSLSRPALNRLASPLFIPKEGELGSTQFMVEWLT